MASFSWLAGREGILRRYKRGGVVRFVLRDKFILANRPLREFRAHRAALDRGIPAPSVLGVCWTRNGIFYSGALATEKAEGADLHDWLLSNTNETGDRTRVLKMCGSLIKRMHEAGIIHGDLQIKNIFIAESGPLLLDFDGARIDPNSFELRCQGNLLRLRRSFTKRGHEDECFETLLEGYGTVTFYKGVDIFYRVKGFLSDRIRNWRKH